MCDPNLIESISISFRLPYFSIEWLMLFFFKSRKLNVLYLFQGVHDEFQKFGEVEDFSATKKLVSSKLFCDTVRQRINEYVT